MSEGSGPRNERTAATRAPGVTYWMTEYQRVFLMTAARFRRQSRSSGARTGPAAIPARRDWESLERVTAAFSQL
jgi:hypothetical protein